MFVLIAFVCLRRITSKLSATAVMQVLEANARFYQAFQSGSLGAMGKVWGFGDHVRVIHPGAGCIEGRDEVR